MKDPTDFRKRVAAYRLGKLPYLAGRPIDDDEEEFLSTYDFIKKFEGDRDTVYLDSKGIKTVGMGFTDEELIKAVEARRVGNKPGKITDEERLRYYNKHITKAEDEVRSIVPLYDKMSPEAHTALLSYYYNYPAGYKGGYLTNESYVKRPTRFIEALHNRDYKTAAKEMDAGMNDKNSPGLRTRRLEELKYFMHDGSPIPSQRPITITLDKRKKAFDKFVGNTVEYTRQLVLDADEAIAKRSQLKPPFIKKYANGKSPYEDDRTYTTSDYVLPELVITPTKDSPEELAIEQAYLDRFKNRRLEIPVDHTSEQDRLFRLGILEQRDAMHNSPWMWGLRGLAAAPAAVMAPLANKAMQTIVANPYVNTALDSYFGASGMQSLANGEADWTTALEVAPMFKLAKPLWNVGKEGLLYVTKVADNLTRKVYAPYDFYRTILETAPSTDVLNKLWYSNELTFAGPGRISRFLETPKVGDFIDYGFNQGTLKGIYRDTPFSELTESQKNTVEKIYTNRSVFGDWFPRYRDIKGSKLIHLNETGALPISSTGFVPKDATNSNSPWVQSIEGEPAIWYNRNRPYYNALAYPTYLDIPETLITNQGTAEHFGLTFDGTQGKDISNVLKAPLELPFEAVEYGIRPNQLGFFDRIKYTRYPEVKPVKTPTIELSQITRTPQITTENAASTTPKVNWDADNWFKTISGRSSYSSEEAAELISHVPEYRAIEKRLFDEGKLALDSNGNIIVVGSEMSPQEYIMRQSKAFQKMNPDHHYVGVSKSLRNTFENESRSPATKNRYAVWTDRKSPKNVEEYAQSQQGGYTNDGNIERLQHEMSIREENYELHQEQLKWKYEHGKISKETYNRDLRTLKNNYIEKQEEAQKELDILVQQKQKDPLNGGKVFDITYPKETIETPIINAENNHWAKIPFDNVVRDAPSVVAHYKQRPHSNVLQTDYIVSAARRNGYGVIHIDDVMDTYDGTMLNETIIGRDTPIKSVLGNTGNFDIDSPNKWKLYRSWLPWFLGAGALDTVYGADQKKIKR